MSGVYLARIGYAHGEPVATETLAEQSEVDLSKLAADVPTFRASDREIWRLAVDAVTGTLAGSPEPPGLLVYVSENDPDPTASVARLADVVGLDTVDYLTMAGHDCGNLVPALRVAHDTVVAGRYESVLVVLADGVQSLGRLMVNGMSVLSDGASSCLVSASVAEGTGARFRFAGFAGRTRIARDPVAGPDQSILGTVALAGDSVHDLLERTKTTRADYRHVVFGNYRLTSQRFLMSAMRFPKDSLLAGDVTELGHSFSADVLVTLAQRYDQGYIAEGDRVVASATGPYSWSMVSLESL